MSNVTDRRDGVSEGLAAKRPCRVVAISNITLSGTQTIDGVAVVAGNRVLATAQTSSVDNGIWVVAAGAWTRAKDFDGLYDAVSGTQVRVNSGTTYSGTLWVVSTSDDFTIGTDSLSISQFAGQNGATGSTGAAGAGYGGTSTTSLLIANSVTKTFTTQAGLAYLVGNYVRASSAAGGANFMEGTVSSYSGTTLAIAVTNIGGSGTKADWTFSIAGAPGSVGAGSIGGNTGAFTLSNGVTNLVNDIRLDPVYLRGYYSGLTLSNDGVSPNTVLDIAAGVATDVAVASMMKLASAYTKTTGAWLVGTGNGALDTGAVANNTSYHVFLIQRSDTSVVDILFSTSATAPTMPTNYDRKRRIGAFITSAASTNIRTFVQLGNEFLLKASVLDVSGSGMSVTAGNAQLTVPNGIIVKAKLIARNNAGTATTRLWVYSPQMTDEAASSTNSLSVLSSTTAITTPIEVWTDTSRNVRVVADVALGTYDLRTYGWTDLI